MEREATFYVNQFVRGGGVKVKCNRKFLISLGHLGVMLESSEKINKKSYCINQLVRDAEVKFPSL